MQQVVPALRIRSFAASKVIYEEVGFEEQRTREVEKDYPVFASLSINGMQIFLSEHTQGCSLGPDIHDMLIVDPDGNCLSFLTFSTKATT